MAISIVDQLSYRTPDFSSHRISGDPAGVLTASLALIELRVFQNSHPKLIEGIRAQNQNSPGKIEMSGTTCGPSTWWPWENLHSRVHVLVSSIKNERISKISRHVFVANVEICLMFRELHQFSTFRLQDFTNRTSNENENARVNAGCATAPAPRETTQKHLKNDNLIFRR